MACGVNSKSVAVSLGNCLGLKSTIAFAQIMQKCRPNERTDQFRGERTQSCEARQSTRNGAFEQQCLY
jgi:hypothetical protein